MKVINTNKNLYVGDYLYKLRYFTYPILQKRFSREITKLKIKKINQVTIQLFNGERIHKDKINNEFYDEYFTSKKLMFKNKLKKYMDEYSHIIKEIKYLEKKVKESK